MNPEVSDSLTIIKSKIIGTTQNIVQLIIQIIQLFIQKYGKLCAEFTVKSDE